MWPERSDPVRCERIVHEFQLESRQMRRGRDRRACGCPYRLSGDLPDGDHDVAHEKRRGGWTATGRQTGDELTVSNVRYAIARRSSSVSMNESSKRDI